MSTQPVLSKQDGKMIGSALRWGAIGVLPASEVADMALDAINRAKSEEFEPARAVLDEMRRGVLPTQEACINAQKCLTSPKIDQEDDLSAPRFGG